MLLYNAMLLLYVYFWRLGKGAMLLVMMARDDERACVLCRRGRDGKRAGRVELLID